MVGVISLQVSLQVPTGITRFLRVVIRGGRISTKSFNASLKSNVEGEIHQKIFVELDVFAIKCARFVE